MSEGTASPKRVVYSVDRHAAAGAGVALLQTTEPQTPPASSSSLLPTCLPVLYITLTGSRYMRL
eukprot:928742-Pleurochrysis_carterae.AAC.1